MQPLITAVAIAARMLHGQTEGSYEMLRLSPYLLCLASPANVVESLGCAAGIPGD